jgi:hypothetical protein
VLGRFAKTKQEEDKRAEKTKLAKKETGKSVYIHQQG